MIGDVEVRAAGAKGRGVYARRPPGCYLNHSCDPNAMRTVVGSSFAMDEARQALLVDHAPPFIRREYRRRHRT